MVLHVKFLAQQRTSTSHYLLLFSFLWSNALQICLSQLLFKDTMSNVFFLPFWFYTVVVLVRKQHNYNQRRPGDDHLIIFIYKRVQDYIIHLYFVFQDWDLKSFGFSFQLMKPLFLNSVKEFDVQLFLKFQTFLDAILSISCFDQIPTTPRKGCSQIFADATPVTFCISKLKPKQFEVQITEQIYNNSFTSLISSLCISID